MNIVITGRHTQIRQKFRDVVEGKMNRVTAIAPDAQRVEIVLSHEGNPRQADSAKRIEMTVLAGKNVIRAEASGADEYSAFDKALDRLTIRLRRTRDRRKDHRRGMESEPSAVPMEIAIQQPEPPMESSNPDNSVHKDAMASDLEPGQVVEVQVGDTPIVIRRKLHISEPMSIDDAIYRMELIGHDFFLFVNSQTNRPSVVYRRHGWSYGVFEIDTPEQMQSGK